MSRNGHGFKGAELGTQLLRCAVQRVSQEEEEEGARVRVRQKSNGLRRRGPHRSAGGVREWVMERPRRGVEGVTGRWMSKEGRSANGRDQVGEIGRGGHSAVVERSLSK